MDEASDVGRIAGSLGKSNLHKVYDGRFYERQVATAIESAEIYLKFMWRFFQPRSVLDVGCGRGAWLKVCHDLGSTALFGFDGDWNSQSLMIDPTIKFQAIDLNKPFHLSEKVDLAMTLEVAEHLQPSSASQFVKSMTEASDRVLFSAAFAGQGGINHINEQPHSYWAEIFAALGFAPFDLFRARFWGEEKVCYWYRQNTFLYVKRDSVPYEQLKALGLSEIENVAFMDCVHPELLEWKTASFRDHVTDLVPSLWRTIRRRLG
jgi:SAM-dependent methyltransferase